MPIAFTCPTCKRRISIPSKHEGARGRCPGCKTVLVVPGVSEPAAVLPGEHSEDMSGFPEEEPANTVRDMRATVKIGEPTLELAPEGAPTLNPTHAATSESHRPGPAEGSAVPPEVAKARSDPRRVFGRFVLLAELGKGGMGVVHRAWDDRLKRIVAIKTILPSGEDTDTLLKRFYREAQAAARLRHANIVSVFDVGEIDKKHYLAMDFIDGTTFDRALRGRTLTRRKIVEVLRDVALAVHHAHGQGVIHRDLKPANILLDKAGTPYVMDFGIAGLRDSTTKLTKTGTAMGTVAYMPPEQAQGEVVSERADVYALGATLYHSIVGRPPFEGNTDASILLAALTKNAAPPREIDPSIAVDLETICMKCLEKEPEGRYQTALALAEDLTRYLMGEPISARPIGAVEKVVRQARSRAQVVVGVAVAALLAIVVLSVASSRLGEAQRAHEEAERLKAEAEEKARAGVRDPRPTVPVDPAPVATPFVAPHGVVEAPPVEQPKEPDVPELAELDPKEGTSVVLAEPVLKVTGRLTDPKVGSVRIGEPGKPLLEKPLDAQGRFTARLGLEPGATTVDVRAGRPPGERVATIKVEVDPDPPSLTLDPVVWRGGPLVVTSSLRAKHPKAVKISLAADGRTFTPVLARLDAEGRASVTFQVPQGAKELLVGADAEDALGRKTSVGRAVTIDLSGPHITLEDPRGDFTTGEKTLSLRARVEGELAEDVADVAVFPETPATPRVRVPVKEGVVELEKLPLPERDGTFRVEVFARGKGGIVGRASFLVRVDRARPTIKLELPATPLPHDVSTVRVIIRTSKPVASLLLNGKDLGARDSCVWAPEITVAKPGGDAPVDVVATDSAGNASHATEKVKRDASARKLPPGMRLGPRVPLGDSKQLVQVYVYRLPSEDELELVYVPPGAFTMGAPAQEGTAEEHPQHEHAMPRGYWISRNLTTWGQYRGFCKAAGRRMPQVPHYPGPDNRPQQNVKDDMPVVNVTSDDAQAFCEWASMRLPSEPEWEKAARGADGRRNPWGDAKASADLCIFEDHPVYGNKSPAPVGSCLKGSSPYGALDMVGNVLEWTADFMERDTYERWAKGDYAPAAPGNQRATRGCMWFGGPHGASDPSAVRASARAHAEPQSTWDGLGFRALKPS
ncbi:SUMF1/EgtB/PvdO family nonheme iron enzyme [bacterium]|nr:SUMF1/EgtB/PvdO family nonheme iron enzyme [bacterium]